MTLKDYFENTQGLGILSTADDQGRVDAAIYARPHILDEETIAFIMRDRLTHHNLQSNPYAAYLFIEENAGYNGKRLYLTKIREEEESELLYALRRKKYSPEKEAEKGPKFLVIFKLERERPLIGGEI